VFTSLQENFAVASKEIDANYFQHQPFMTASTRARAPRW
jgi:ABC-type metal ion transport system substrate-binding protein